MLVTSDRLRRLAAVEQRSRKSTAAAILHESVKQTEGRWDIFLSHSSMDAELIFGVKAMLEEYGFTVYVDWIDDPSLIRSKVNKISAGIIRSRMRSCSMLLYAHTINASVSKWCPWELGYFDGRKSGNVFVLPISTDTQHVFSGQEYLGLYPYIDEAVDKANIKQLWINYDDDRDAINLKKAKLETFAL
jgi:hypothetical protein